MAKKAKRHNKLYWLNLEMQFAVGDCWRFAPDGETWIVDEIFHNGIERAAVCHLHGNPKDVARFPISAIVRTADKIETRSVRAA